ncbi:TPM domain-containing protein [bacterium]|nr:TPM domain-containing protein [bacterium]
MKKILVLFIMMFSFVLAGFASTLSFEFDGSGFISDGASVITQKDAEEMAFYLDYVNKKKNYTVLVITIDSLEGLPASKVAGTIAKHSNIEDKDNLMVFLVAPKEAKIGIELGENMKKALPYEKLSEIINEKVAPSFQSENYSEALKSGIYSILYTLTPSVETLNTALIHHRPNVNTTSARILPSGLLSTILIFITGILALYYLAIISAKRAKVAALRYRRCGFGRLFGKSQLLFEQEFLEKK